MRKKYRSPQRIFFRSILVCGLLLSGCSSVTPNFAKTIIAQDTGIPEKQIEVKEVSQYPGSIVVDARLNLAFSLQQDRSGQWHVLKISKIPGQWEEPEKVLPASALGRSLQSALLSELIKQ